MARTSLHDLLNEVAGAVQLWSSTFSGAASILFPGADKHLRIYNVILTQSNAGADTEVQLGDGSDPVIGHAYFGAGEERPYDFRPFYWRVNTALNVQRPSGDQEITVSVWYKERPDNHV